MRVLDIHHQHGSGMNVYAGYGFGKHLRKAFGKAQKHGMSLVKNVGQDVAKDALKSALSGNLSTDSVMNSAKQSAVKRGKNEVKGAIRPYL